MTDSLDVLYRRLGLPPAALRLARGDLANELGTLVHAPYETLGHPPAFLPLYMVDYPVLVGWWVDPFEKREAALVECTPARGYRVEEYVRSWEQLAFYLVVHLIVVDDSVEAATPLATALGVELPRAADVARTFGDDLAAFGSLRPFADNPPWDAASYRGQWPFPGRALKRDDLVRAAGLELLPAQQRELCREVDAPPWLVTVEQPDLFGELFGRGRYEDAWRALNSPGWTFSAAKHAMSLLARAVDNETLRALATIWCAQPHERWGGYGRTDRTTWWGGPEVHAFREPGEPPVPHDLEAVIVTVGSEFAPDSSLGEQSVAIERTGGVHYRRRQRGQQWERTTTMDVNDAHECLRMLASTPFPRVARHSWLPGATGVKVRARFTDGTEQDLVFDSSAPETFVYAELIARVKALCERLYEEAAPSQES